MPSHANVDTVPISSSMGSRTLSNSSPIAKSRPSPGSGTGAGHGSRAGNLDLDISPSPSPNSAHVRPTFVHSSTSYATKHKHHRNQASDQEGLAHSRSSEVEAQVGSAAQRHHSSSNASSSSSGSGSGSGSRSGFSSSQAQTNRASHPVQTTGSGFETRPTRYSDYPIPVDYSSKESYPPSDRPYSQNHHAAIQMPENSHHITLSSTPSGPRRDVGCSIIDTWERMKGACRCSGEGGLGKAMMIGWIITTVLVLVVLGWWRGELFQALDDLSKDLASQGLQGQLTIFLLILLTTIPPFPLYSTLIILSGYTFGAWDGFVVSYAASLVGAILVFVVSRGWLKDVITKSLASSPTSMSLLNLLPSNPHLLLLIRIAPYPYNLLNVILASSPSLTLRTYTGCTAISLCKLILHTWIGAGIHDLSASYGHGQGSELHQGPNGVWEDGEEDEKDDHWPHLPLSPSATTTVHHGDGPPGLGHDHGHGHGHGHPPMEASREDVKLYTTWAGIILCIALFFYLTHLAKRALKRAQRERDEREEREREMRECGTGGRVRLMSFDGNGIRDGRASEEV